MALYPVTERFVLLVLGGILSPLISAAFFVISRRRHARSDTLKKQSYVFYQVLAGVLIGQYMCHTMVPLTSADIHFFFAFVLGMYILLHMLSLIGRAWNHNPYYMGPVDDADLPLDASIDSHDMSSKHHMLASDVSSADFAAKSFVAADLNKDAIKRRWMLALLFSAFAFISVMDGLLMIYRQPADGFQHITIVVAYFTNGVSMSGAIYGGMIHAKIHVIERRGKRLLVWCLLSLLWSIILVCSAIPALVDVPLDIATCIIEHRAFIAFYGLATAAVLHMHVYWLDQKLHSADRRQLAVGFALFLVAAAQAAVTGFWF